MYTTYMYVCELLKQVHVVTACFSLLDVSQAGKVTPRSGGAKECIMSPVQPPTPEQVRKFRGATRPSPGEKRILHSFVGDIPPNPDLRHGVVTKASLEVSLFIHNCTATGL